MGDIFKALSGGFSRFAVSWLFPSAAALAIFCIFVYPSISKSAFLAPIETVVDNNGIEGAILFSFVTILLSLIFSLTSLPYYRFLEGYVGPKRILRRLYKRSVRRHAVLIKLHTRMPTSRRIQRELLQEKIAQYPADARDLLPTRLGNAFKSLETYGYNTFGLDSQSFWYELNSTVPERLRRDHDDARASVDFFLALLFHLAWLSLFSLTIAMTSWSLPALIVGIISLLLMRPAYIAAVANTADWRESVRALVNMGRVPLSTGLGYELPRTMEEERSFWTAWLSVIGRQKLGALRDFDELRTRPGVPLGPDGESNSDSSD
jgi:hypothetical protein